MDIYRTSGLVAGLLIATGIIAYIVASLDGAASFTALIPSFLGAVIGGLTAFAKAKPTLAKGIMHGVVVVALLGALGSLRFVPILMSGDIELPIALVAQMVTFALCTWLVIASIRHFRARRAA
ncbi:MAG: hypothetical protein AAGI52_08155 [Bacteroidota bacterium]